MANVPAEDPPDREERKRILGKRAREGNVQAIKLLNEMEREDGERDDDTEGFEQLG